MECLTDQLASSGRTLLVEGGAAGGMHLDIDLLFPRFCIVYVPSLLRPSATLQIQESKTKKNLFDGEPAPRIPLHICADRWGG